MPYNITFTKKNISRTLILFYEYFHGDNGRGVGATHQTGWTGVVAQLIDESCWECDQKITSKRSANTARKKNKNK